MSVYVLYKLPEEATKENREGQYVQECEDSAAAVKIIRQIYIKYGRKAIEVRLERDQTRIPKNYVLLKASSIPS